MQIVSYIRWCFKDPRDAEDFQAAFGGMRVAPRPLAGITRAFIGCRAIRNDWESCLFSC